MPEVTPATQQQQTPPVAEETEGQTPPEESQQEAVEAEAGEGAPGEPPEPAQPESVPLRRFNEVYGRMKELERTLLEVAKSRPEPEQRAMPAAPPPDLDTFTNRELADYILQAVGSSVQKYVKDSVTPIASRVDTERVSRDIQETATKHQDFWDYREKMIEISTRHPSLSAEEVYFLASNNPAEAKKSAARRVAAQVAKKKAARTEMRSSPSEKVTEQKEYKSVREAGLAAAKKLGMM